MATTQALRARIARQARSARRLPRRLLHAAEVAGQVLWWTATLQLRAGLQRRRDARLVRRSELFDPDHYLAQCPGEASARRNPVEHYLRVGAGRGLDPSPLFDTRAYLARHPELAPGANPLVHHLRSSPGGGAPWTAPSGVVTVPPWAGDAPRGPPHGRAASVLVVRDPPARRVRLALRQSNPLAGGS